ncbi:MAG: GNAT family N-acetyltransferase [Proteobacteria bacterium]|nr:GNAT family N-acetyltransferase [Pseudomonadota bacterium]
MTIGIYEGGRAALLPLFLLADESDSQIESYYRLGTVLAAYDGTSVVGLAHLVDDEGYVELVSLAVSPQSQRQGIGTRLIEAAADYCRANNFNRLIVGTGAWENENIVFYLNRGFQIFNVNRGFFTPEKGYADGRCDQVQLEMSV